ncbi:uncharacterized protein H6S33_004894 [Morchella sextelata]|uniref:uncharacterized protein n=1 Tax=Morchella sextelata TaxID=1174677 RepID=UPI001D04FA32|nr:uncharacterized protein H6S33_004894 [Morchella sextelata]KAH0605672.1 hypothetical protein H6S33_004894 [Morchella sextelata]
MVHDQEILGRSDMIAVIIGGITIVINLIAISSLFRCYQRRRLVRAVARNANSTTTAVPPIASSPIHDHRESRPERVDLENGSENLPRHIPVIPNMQHCPGGAPEISHVIPHLPQRPSAAQLKSENGTDGLHGLSPDDRYKAPSRSTSRDHRPNHAQK